VCGGGGREEAELLLPKDRECDKQKEFVVLCCNGV
jgi:hypothetical protein